MARHSGPPPEDPGQLAQVPSYLVVSGTYLQFGGYLCSDASGS